MAPTVQLVTCSYADASVDGKLVQLNCGHYVHDFEYKRIAEEIQALAERL